MSDSLPIRQALVQTLREALEPADFILAFWEAGSAAMGTADQWSDLDLQVVVTDGQVEATRQLVEAALTGIAPIDLKFEVPQPSWHGHWQAFYRLQGVDPLLLIDLVIMEEKTPGRFLEPEIHGKPVVYLDRQGVTEPQPTDAAAQAARMQKRLPLLELPAELFHRFVEKELRRGREVDAMSFYQGVVLNRLVEALRMRYCPWRYNFGMRYLQRDLPPIIYGEVEHLTFVAQATELPAKTNRAMGLLRVTLNELKGMNLAAHLEAHR